jgi:uncharacterized membrane protein
MRKLARIFLAGLLAALPLMLTLFVTAWLLSFLNQYLGPNSGFGSFLRSLGLGADASEYAPYFIGLAVIVGGIFMLGLIVQSRLGSWIAGLFESVIRRVPVISNLYDLSSRFVSIVDSGDGDGIKNMTPAWCFFGGKPGAAVLALLPSRTPIKLGTDDYYGVLIPSAPVPFGGALIYVPAAWIEMTDSGIDDLMSVYVSMGITPPSGKAPGGRDSGVARA